MSSVKSVTSIPAAPMERKSLAGIVKQRREPDADRQRRRAAACGPAAGRLVLDGDRRPSGLRASDSRKRLTISSA